jgi:hypothetical protein
MAIKDTDFIEPGELEILVRCKQLVEKMLDEECRFWRWLDDHNKDTKHSEIKIARLEYALGLRRDFPNIKEMLERE